MEKSKKKCNQCDFASFYAGDLKKHLVRHSGERSNKCNQCDFALFMQVIAETFHTSYASNLQKHFKMYNGEKSNKCDQCNYASFYASNLQKRSKMDLFMHAI